MARHNLPAASASEFAKALTIAPISKIRVRRFTTHDQNLINITASYTDENGHELEVGLDSDSERMKAFHAVADGNRERELAIHALVHAMRAALGINEQQTAAHPASPDAVFARTVTSLGIIARNPAAHILPDAA